MLTDQNLHDPKPVFAVGPELFFDPAGPLGLDIEAMLLFRDRLRNAGQFRFAFFSLHRPALCNLDKLIEAMGDMGVQFNIRAIVDPMSDTAVTNARKLASLMEFVYSPELTQKIQFPCSVLTCSNNVMLQALEEFSLSIAAYDKAIFKARVDFLSSKVYGS